jgi:DNA-binding SARP family transcriptional activator
MLIRVHIQDGNYYAALRDYHDFRSRMLRELGIAPSDQMQALVSPILRLRRANVVAVSDRASGRSPSPRARSTWPAATRLRPSASARSSPTAEAR